MPQITVRGALRRWWKDGLARDGFVRAAGRFISSMWTFLRESTPEQRRRRYGDADYDWDHRVNTTSGTVGWRDRLLGVFLSPYQPTEPALFREMLDSLQVDFTQFTFIDIGSGKGRTLLMASDYPFRRIVGVELLPELHRCAEENITKYKSDTQQCSTIESICADARQFVFPPEPMIVYLFNPLPEAGLIELLRNLESSLREHPRTVYLIYHNPLLERVLGQSTTLSRVAGTRQYAVYANSDQRKRH